MGGVLFRIWYQVAVSSLWGPIDFDDVILYQHSSLVSGFVAVPELVLSFEVTEKQNGWGSYCIMVCISSLVTFILGER